MVRATGCDRVRLHLHWVSFKPSILLTITCLILRANKARSTVEPEALWVGVEWKGGVKFRTYIPLEKGILPA